MAKPLKVKYDNTGKPCGLAEFTTEDAFGIEIGGTGATTAEGARENLDVYSKEEVDAKATGATITFIDDDYTAQDTAERIVVDTSQKEITVTLSGLSGDNTDGYIIWVQDGANNAQNNPITVTQFGGTEEDFIIDMNNGEVVFVSHNHKWIPGV